LNVRRAKFIIIVAASLVTAAAVSFAGIIGFVGSSCRTSCGSGGCGLSPLDPLSIIGGAAVLLFADVLSRIVLVQQETAGWHRHCAAGAPFFLWVLRRAKNRELVSEMNMKDKKVKKDW